jgi:hypothetical protein
MTDATNQTQTQTQDAQMGIISVKAARYAVGRFTAFVGLVIAPVGINRSSDLLPFLHRRWQARLLR